MDLGFAGQYVLNGVVLGVIYAMVAVGFTLFFGVLDVIKFSHGDVVMAGAFTALAVFGGLQAMDAGHGVMAAMLLALSAMAAMALLGAAVAKFLIIPLKRAPSLNTLLITLMFGLALREAVRLFYPGGSNPKPFPRLLPTEALTWGNFTLRLDSVLLVGIGVGAIVAVHWLIRRTRLGLAIRAVAQDAETAQVMGIDFERVVVLTFALGSALAALAGVANGLYYNEVNFSMGLLLGVIGFSAAVVGGLGSLYGAIIGGFLFAALQTVGAIWFSVPAYKDVFAFACIIALMAWKPTGLIAERSAERV
ncbi:MAG TPA: branched-chain amino acid ABC transporter permease [Burkholderiales bacterium]|jgi:branched-chain amino acid transport system permease protein|nr:branched-chain amino acid ABC transporter permease [Burkholderiales bacterium]